MLGWRMWTGALCHPYIESSYLLMYIHVFFRLGWIGLAREGWPRGSVDSVIAFLSELDFVFS